MVLILIGNGFGVILEEFELESHHNRVFFCPVCDCKSWFYRGCCERCGEVYHGVECDPSFYGVSGVGFAILDCGVEFHPERLICRGHKRIKPCPYVRYCFQFHCVDYDEYRLFKPKGI